MHILVFASTFRTTSRYRHCHYGVVPYAAVAPQSTNTLTQRTQESAQIKSTAVLGTWHLRVYDMAQDNQKFSNIEARFTKYRWRSKGIQQYTSKTIEHPMPPKKWASVFRTCRAYMTTFLEQKHSSAVLVLAVALHNTKYQKYTCLANPRTQARKPEHSGSLPLYDVICAVCPKRWVQKRKKPTNRPRCYPIPLLIGIPRGTWQYRSKWGNITPTLTWTTTIQPFDEDGTVVLLCLHEAAPDTPQKHGQARVILE